VWQAAEKVVYSRTILAPASARTRIERTFEPDAVRQLKQSSSTDITVGGGDLAGQAIKAGLVDECHFLLFPIAVGGGKRVLPDNAHTQFELVDQRRFKSGVVHLRYCVSSPGSD
jgi:dihydrofolate reductase